MDDHDVLQHLLNLDTEAAALVDDAQTEADQRITSGEKQNRLRYDEIYAREVEALELSFTRDIAEIKEDYRRQLDLYRENLITMPLNTKAFSSLAEKLLLIRKQ